MPARTIAVEKVAYQIFVNREQGGYRGFWFCPHHDCFGAFRNEVISDSKDDAIELATEAAEQHEQEVHGREANEFPEIDPTFAAFSLKLSTT